MREKDDKMKTKIVIGEDYDGFLGYDQSAIDQIDIEESISNYESMFLKRINQWYPELEVEFIFVRLLYDEETK
jgi:hypothetical protein